MKSLSSTLNDHQAFVGDEDSIHYIFFSFFLSCSFCCDDFYFYSTYSVISRIRKKSGLLS